MLQQTTLIVWSPKGKLQLQILFFCLGLNERIIYLS